mgnify:CR=1 FL=1
MIIIYICIFFLGASIASYINATLYRIEKGIKLKILLTQSSYCEECKKKLTWYELVPILGYIYIGGKCSKCKTKVNIIYPLSELFLGISFLLMYMYSVPFYIWIILLLLFILSYYDILYREVPRILVHILIGISLLIFIFFNLNLISVLLTGGILLILALLTLIIKKSFGLGDFLILLSLGLALTYKQFVVLFWLSIFTALLYAICFSILQKKRLKGIKIPMIPFFTISYLVASIWGVTIFDFLLESIYFL